MKSSELVRWMRHAFMVLAGVSAAFMASAAAPEDTLKTPQLIVVMSIDQFGAALFNQHRASYRQGLLRLIEQGVVFPEAYQSHAATETCPGHSTLLSGRHPSATGVVANHWRDRVTGAPVYCVYDVTHPVPGRPDSPRGPAHLKVSVFGEWLKQANPASRVFGISGKDRAAIAMTGHHPDGVFWWDDERGFTTSVPAGSDERARLEGVSSFNRQLFDSWSKKTPTWDIADAKCLAHAETRQYGALTIHHQVPPLNSPSSTGPFSLEHAPSVQRWLRASPVLDQATLDLAAELITHYHLGQSTAPDLLTISLSATDYIGHRYGLQGPEMCDQIAHLDQSIGHFMDVLKNLNVPTLLVMTADHGSVDAAEQVAEHAVPADRIDLTALMGQLNSELRKALRLDIDPIIGDGQQLYISPKIVLPTMRQRVSLLATKALRQMPQVVDVFTSAQLAQIQIPHDKPANELTLAERFAESFDATRSGDLSVAYKAYASFGFPKSPGDAIAEHGSPWNYDRRVPLVFWWPGSTGFEQSLPVETVDIAPTLAALVGIKTPPVDGRCLELQGKISHRCLSTR